MIKELVTTIIQNKDTSKYTILSFSTILSKLTN